LIGSIILRISVVAKRGRNGNWTYLKINRIKQKKRLGDHDEGFVNEIDAFRDKWSK